MSKTIGFIGLGNMGKPMALNLIKAGFELAVSFDASVYKERGTIVCGAGGRPPKLRCSLTVL